MKFVRKKGDQWYIDFRWPDGLRTRRDMPTEAKANELSIRFQSSRVDGTWRELRARLDLDTPEEFTFKELSAIYLKEYVEHNNRSKDSKSSRIAILGKRFNSMQVSSITPHDVKGFISGRKKSGAGNGTINRDLTVLRHMLTWAAQESYIRTKDIPEIHKLKEVKWEGQRPSEEIIDAVFAHLDPRVVPLFTFIRWTGCRREEALSLKHEQLDFGRSEVVFKDNTKNGKPRRVLRTKRALEAIAVMPKASKYVFYHPESLDRWDTCKKPWIQAREAAGYPWLRIHDLRRAYGIKLAESGCPMHFISEVLGHHSSEFTRRVYAKFSPDAASKAGLAVS
jgi:integrase